MNLRTYTTPLAFKEAVEKRLRQMTAGGADFTRRRQILIFERFLSRIAHVFGEAAILKGGLVLEFRLSRARTTNDVDLRLTGSPQDILVRLQKAGQRDEGDFLAYEIVPDADQPAITHDGLRYDGFRFRATCTLAGKLYGQPFGVDIAYGDPIFGEPERIIAQDRLGFAGIAPPEVRLYPVETHIAEKLHAYTLPRERTNSRVKDLPDIALLATAKILMAERLRAALEQTFTFRATHELPSILPAPPDLWTRPYAAIANEDQLPWTDVHHVHAAASSFINPVLNGTARGQWTPARWAWEFNLH
jgi:Nucleotidyl transferase AbiEii toxin, Type IV TA system